VKRGSDEASEETDDAIRDHNELGDAIRAAAGADPRGQAWWGAVLARRKANDAQLAEEERDVIPDFREHSDQQLRDGACSAVHWTALVRR
jgi:hypothetical protein